MFTDLNVGFSTESELKAFLDFLYAKSGQSISFTGLLEAMCHEVTIVTAVHNIKSNKGSKTAGVDEIKMDSYLQMPKQELIDLIQRKFHKYNKLPVEKINKVSNLAWLCVPCHRMVHNSPIYPGTDQKTIRKIGQYKQKLT